MVGINYYKMCQASRHMVSYAACAMPGAVPSCTPNGSPVVGWGTGWRNHGFPGRRFSKVISIWLGGPRFVILTCIEEHGRNQCQSNPYFDDSRFQQLEILKGLGRLYRHSQIVEPRVYMPYSQVSVYVGNVLNRDYPRPSDRHGVCWLE